MIFFLYDSKVNLVADSSKGLKISYDWRGMPVEFLLEPTGSSSDTARLSMMYDGSGRRISKTVMHKVAGAADWDTAQVTHYTGIGTEIRENYAGPTKETKVVVNMPQGLGRYGIEDAENPDMGSGAGYIPNTKFEWYLKNHLGSTMLVYGTQADANPTHSDIGTPLATYDYRAFGEMIELTPPPTGKITENFTGKEHDDEISLDYFGARYLDPMLGMWISVDSARQFASPYLYAGNGMNPVNVVDPDGNEVDIGTSIAMNDIIEPAKQAIFESSLDVGLVLMAASAAFDIGVLATTVAVTTGPKIVAAGASAARNAAVGARAMFAAGASKTIGFAQEFMSCPQCVIGMVGTASKTFPIIEPLKIGSVKVFDGLKIGPVNIFSGLEALGGFISGPGPYVGKAEAAGVLMNVFKEIIKNNDLKLNIVPQNKD